MLALSFTVGGLVSHFILKRAWPTKRDLDGARKLPGYDPVLPTAFALLCGTLASYYSIATVDSVLIVFTTNFPRLEKMLDWYLAASLIAQITVLLWHFKNPRLSSHFHVLA